MSSDENNKTVNLNIDLFEACKDQNIDLVKGLIAQGAQASYVSRTDGVWGAYDQESILHSAIYSLKDEASKIDRENWKDIIKILLSNGADPNGRKESYNWKGTGQSLTAFDLWRSLATKEDSGMIKLFLKAGLNPNLSRVKNIHSMRTDGVIKNSLLHDLTNSGDPEFIIELLEAGTDVESRATEDIDNERGFREKKSNTALHIAASNGDNEICVILLSKGSNIDSIHYFIDSTEDENIKNENTTDDPRDDSYKNPWININVECTALHLAIKNGHYDLAKLFLIAGSDSSISYKSGDNYISTIDLFQEGNKAAIEKEESLKNSLSGNLAIKPLITSMSESCRTKILATLTKVSNLGWELKTSNLYELFEVLKSSE